MEPLSQFVNRIHRFIRRIPGAPPLDELHAELDLLAASASAGATPPDGPAAASPEPLPHPPRVEPARPAPSFRHPPLEVEPVTLSLEAFDEDRPLAAFDEEAPPEVERIDDNAEPPLPERYRYRAFIDEGGMGRVHRVYDRYLSRTVALKVMKARLARSSRQVRRFLSEAQATSQLQHPGIVPVYDVGRLKDGRYYYAMKEVYGETFKDVIRRVHEASPAKHWSPTEDGWSFRRLVETFLRVCEAMGYAHERGVVHRDLKPSNIMLGRHGEVLVLDWGLAKVKGEQERPGVADDLQPVQTLVTREGQALTRVGRVAGTVAYMSPEQARAEVNRLGPGSDVYSLGTILYEVLSGGPAFRGLDDRQLLQDVKAGRWKRPKREAWVKRETVSGTEELSGSWRLPESWKPPEGPPLPEELVAICEKAMAHNPEARYADAGALARVVREWLEQARRRERGLEALSQVEALPERILERRREAAEKRAQAEAYLSKVKSWEAIEKKRPGWELEDAAAKLEQTADLEAIHYTQGVRGALTQDPELAEAHRALARYYRAGHVEAEARRDTRSAAQWELLLREHDRRQEYAAYLKGDGAVTLVTEPAGAEVALYRYEAEDRYLVPKYLRELGRTPLREVSLEKGSYLLKVKAPGHQEVLYPVYLERGEHWDGVPPEGGGPVPIWLPPEGMLGPEDCYVPSGWFWAGGDEQVFYPMPRTRVWVDGFVMRKYPVTNREYLAFLNDLVGQGRDGEALRHAPRERSGMYGQEGALIYGRDEEGRFLLQRDADGDMWDPEWPVLQVDWVCALAYGVWEAERRGRSWRLPGELEWEKAARGVDGRFFPWGDAWDPSWACMQDSHQGRPLAQVVGSYPRDVSVYGVRGVGGNVEDWCLDGFEKGGPALASGRYRVPEVDGWLLERLETPIGQRSAVVDRVNDINQHIAEHTQIGSLRVSRGGIWSGTGRSLRCAYRSRLDPGNRLANLGFRLACAAPGPGVPAGSSDLCL